VESYIAKGRDGISEGVSGEGSLLENAKGFHVQPVRGGGSQDNRITLAAARYASEEAAALVHYVIALIEYSKLCQPLRTAKHKVEKLKQDLLEAEQKQLEKENEVCLFKI
jgi:dynein heavy chain